MLDANCPNCGAAIRFRSVDLPIKVCEYCRSAILRAGDALKDMGRVAEVPEDVSPLQIGVRGRDGDQAFEVVGRVRWRWSDGAWNEWLVLFADGSTGWLGEAMGRFMLLRQTVHAAKAGDPAGKLRDGRLVVPGDEARIGGVGYTVTDVKAVTLVGSEGELPFQVSNGLKADSVDLMSADGRCASLQKESGAVNVYTGRYVTLHDLKATGLRAFEGWPMPSFA